MNQSKAEVINNMEFQVLDRFGQKLMTTYYPKCLPSDSELDSMASAEYKFKVDGKIVSKKKVKEIRDGVVR